MRQLVLLLLACFAFAPAALRGATNNDPGDLFVNAYMAVQAGEKLEQAGNFKGALAKLRAAATVLDQITANSPTWQPTIVSYRKARTVEGIARVQDKIARFGAGKADAGEGPSLLPTTPLPENDPGIHFPDPDPILTPSNPGRSSNTGRKTQPPPDRAIDSDPIVEAGKRMAQLKAELENAKAEAARLQSEKADLAKKLEDAAKAKADSEAKQQILQKRADNAEQALNQAVSEGQRDSVKVKGLQADLAAAKKALHDVRIDAEADNEYREQLAGRYKAASTKITQLTEQRDEAQKAASSVPGKIAQIEQELERTKKEKEDLSVKLQKTEGQLAVVQQQRDDALSQVAKLKDAQKQVDKLVADNNTLMAKLADAEKSITQFKTEGAQKDKEIAALKQDVSTAREQLAKAKQESADYQRQMADMQVKLEDAGKQLASARAENTQNAAETKKMQEENSILRGIVLRQQKEEAVRAKTRKVLLAEMADLEINSKTLLKEIDLLSQPVVKLTEKERALFKNAELQVTDSEISIGIVTEPVAATPKAPEPTTPSTSVKAAATPAPAPVVTTTTPTPSTPKAVAAAATPAASTTAARSTPVPVAPATPSSQNLVIMPVAPAPAPAATPTVAKATETPRKTETSRTAEKSKATPEPPLPMPESRPALALEAQPAGPAVGALALNTTKQSSTPLPPPQSSPATDSQSTPPLPENLPNLTTEKGLGDSMPSTSLESAGAGMGASSGSPNVPADLLPLAKEGKDQFERGNYVEAEKTYRKILAKAPNNLYTLSNLGVVLFRAQKYKAAEESFRKAIAIAPEDSFSHCTLGIVYYSVQKYDEAVNELTKTLALNPKNPTAHNYLGITASQKGWQEAAMKELETAVTLDPTYADAHFNLAVVYAMQTPPNKEKAREHYKLAIQYGAEPDAALEQLIKAP